MRDGRWKRSALALLSGMVLFQVPGCTEAALGIMTLASVVTAGGVIYLVTRVID
jgi:hypothetical protein